VRKLRLADEDLAPLDLRLQHDAPAAGRQSAAENFTTRHQLANICAVSSDPRAQSLPLRVSTDRCSFAIRFFAGHARLAPDTQLLDNLP